MPTLNRRELLKLCLAAPLAAKAGFPASVDKSARVREEFLHAWNGYKKYAWGFDELRPLSKGSRNWHSACGILLVAPKREAK